MNKLNILLVEDNPAQAELMLEVFSECEFADLTPHVATDGEVALNMIHQINGYEELARPNLILLDLDIPIKNGKEVLYEIKSDMKYRNIPILVLTSSSAKEDVKRCYQLHANAYLVKPKDYDSLVDMVEKVKDFWLTQVCYA